MSVGIILLNRNGIALAADSALTIGEHEAIYNTGNKVFKLGNYPAGLVTYGNQNFMGVPIELITRDFSNYNTKNPIDYETVEELVENYLKYLRENAKRFGFDQYQEKYIKSEINKYLDFIVKDYVDKAVGEFNKSPESQKKFEDIDFSGQILSIVVNKLKVFNEVFKPIKDFKISEQTKEDYRQYFIEQFKSRDSSIHELFMKDIYELFIELIGKEFYLETGIAIAGYSKNDIYPSMYHLEIGGLIDNSLRYRVRNSYCVTNSKTRWIEILAQSDVIETYIDGISPDLRIKVLEDYPRIILSKINSIPTSQLPIDLKNTIKDLVEQAKNQFIVELDEMVEKNWQPVYDSVASLPILDMINFVENMVGFTSLRRKYAVENSFMTVGGPIDVAFITKFDGFNWYKQKGKETNQ